MPKVSRRPHEEGKDDARPGPHSIQDQPLRHRGAEDLQIAQEARDARDARDARANPSASIETFLRLVASEIPDLLETSGRADLLATIQEKIIPQLILAHAPEASEMEACPDARLPPTEEEVAAFSKLATAEDLQNALAFIEQMANDGLSLEVILLQLVAPTARLLGDEWLDDRRTFTEVTLGLNTLHQVVHVLGPSFAPSAAHRGSVVLVAAPSEQHTLGIYLLAEFLRKDGWGVQVDPTMAMDDLLTLVASERVDMVGISVSNTDLIGPLTRLVASVRGASVNRDLAVMLGGSLVLADDAEEIGAIFCNDAHEAVRILDRHMKTAAHDRP